MNTLCIIPARGGSKRLPGKNIMPILGRPMISYPIGHAMAAKTPNKTVVSTDDEKIAEVARAEGATVIMRPAEFATDTSPIEDSMRHVVRHLESEEGYSADVVVLLLANVVYRRAGLIDDVAGKLLENETLTAVVSCYEVNQRPEWMKKIEGDILVPVMECANFRQQELPTYYLADGAVVAQRRKTLMDTEGTSGVHKFMGDRIGYVIQDRIFGADVDHPEDALTAEILLMYAERKEKEGGN